MKRKVESVKTGYLLQTLDQGAKVHVVRCYGCITNTAGKPDTVFALCSAWHTDGVCHDIFYMRIKLLAFPILLLDGIDGGLHTQAQRQYHLLKSYRENFRHLGRGHYCNVNVGK